MNILVLDDESIIAMEIKENLLDFGYKNIFTSNNPNKAINTVKNNNIDLALMDINLECDIDGIECVKELKKINPNIAIVYITANGDDEEIMSKAIETNPISYLVKPYKVFELQACIKIVENRNKIFTQDNKNLIYFFDGEFSYNPITKELLHNEVEVKLPRREVKLLDTIVQNVAIKFISYAQIEEAVWGESRDDTTRRVLVSNLNSKFNKKLLKNDYGSGYKIVVN